jgi:hypothetical protein
VARNYRDYFVKDHFGIVWNDEPFSTFSQARDFKNYMKSNLNDSRDLKVTSTPRESVPQTEIKPIPVIREVYAANSDF